MTTTVHVPNETPTTKEKIRKRVLIIGASVLGTLAVGGLIVKAILDSDASDLEGSSDDDYQVSE